MKSAVIRAEKTNNLIISEDTGRSSDEPVAVLLFTPTMTDTFEHHHIELSREQAAALKQWLHEFLETTSV